MRHSHACPKCSGKRFVVNSEVRKTHERSDDVTEPIPALTLSHAGSPDDRGWYHGGRELVGSMEAWICLGCGYTEHYTHGLGSEERLAQLAAQYPHLLRIVDASAPPAPHP